VSLSGNKVRGQTSLWGRLSSLLLGWIAGFARGCSPVVTRAHGALIKGGFVANSISSGLFVWHPRDLYTPGHNKYEETSCDEKDRVFLEEVTSVKHKFHIKRTLRDIS